MERWISRRILHPKIRLVHLPQKFISIGRIKSILRSALPEVLLGSVFALFLLIVIWQGENSHRKIVNSDGHGYYAFLPAIFIQKDLSFQSTHKVEKEVSKGWADPNYLMRTKDGKTYNKCYPGVALLQSPFFGFAWLTEAIQGKTSTGYSKTFLYWFYF